MRRHPVLTAALLLYIAWGAWHWIANRPLHPPDGVLAADEPLQTAVPSGDTLRVGRWTLTMRANYQVTARILGREPYHFDALSDLIPEDFVLGWGPMSDNQVLRTMDISQSNRFYYWRVTGALPVPRDSIIAHSANTHVIPRNSMVARQLSGLRQGQIVTLSGDLVDGVRDDGMSIRTSMVRNDSGAGACEVFLVSDVIL
jgi:hypothetical protein